MHIRTLGPLVAALLACPVECFDASALPLAVRRMPADPAEKFYPAYQAFAPDGESAMPLAPREAAAAAVLLDRLYLPASPERPRPRGEDAQVKQPVFRRHQTRADGPLPWDKLRRAAEALKVLQGRNSCPAGFESCAGIGQSDKCCASSETCVEVDDESTGNVACCPAGSSCSGAVASCPADAVTCPLSLGGGCCLAGYTCAGSVCIKNSETTESSSTSASTASTTQDASETSTETTAAAPFRPVSTTTTTTTTTSSSSSSTTPTPTTTESLDTCPTGYYPCLARHGGGCCQTGRDCRETSCAPTSMTAIVTRSDLVIAVPASDAPAASAAASAAVTCAQGWFLCDAIDGVAAAGCCPDNYECGVVSCTLADAEETAAVSKQLATSGASRAAGLAGWVVGSWAELAVATVGTVLLFMT
ncbi:uncharacterized protein BROUX77_006781 [Berkeleyomyces rouxiae]|uniref:uncharacterized protein n=1 Tax=Berkeleyomyces rouxiae TaxID=2035830 RepID=UPI003B82B7FF